MVAAGVRGGGGKADGAFVNVGAEALRIDVDFELHGGVLTLLDLQFSDIGILERKILDMLAKDLHLHLGGLRYGRGRAAVLLVCHGFFARSGSKVAERYHARRRAAITADRAGLRRAVPIHLQ